jgi:RNA recognition motif-containing protein
MNKRLYVGGIPYSSTEETIKEFFSQAGQVDSVRIILDRMTGRSRGFGFVEMADEDGARKAIEMFDGKEFEGRTLVVNEARSEERR